MNGRRASRWIRRARGGNSMRRQTLLRAAVGTSQRRVTLVVRRTHPVSGERAHRGCNQRSMHRWQGQSEARPLNGGSDVLSPACDADSSVQAPPHVRDSSKRWQEAAPRPGPRRTGWDTGIGHPGWAYRRGPGGRRLREARYARVQHVGQTAYAFYAHLSEYLCVRGERVKEGDVFGFSG
jgi:hypothetical protein